MKIKSKKLYNISYYDSRHNSITNYLIESFYKPSKQEILMKMTDICGIPSHESDSVIINQVKPIKF